MIACRRARPRGLGDELEGFLLVSPLEHRRRELRARDHRAVRLNRVQVRIFGRDTGGGCQKPTTAASLSRRAYP